MIGKKYTHYVLYYYAFRRENDKRRIYSIIILRYILNKPDGVSDQTNSLNVRCISLGYAKLSPLCLPQFYKVNAYYNMYSIAT